MRPRSPRGAARQTARAETALQSYTFPGPSGGWVSDQNLTVAQPTCAYVLENIFPTATGGVLRRGCARHADIADGVILTLLTGTVDIVEDSDAVSGSGTDFTTELEVGSRVRIGSADYTVAAIADDDNLTLEEDATETLSGADISLVEASAGGVVRTIISYDAGASNQLFAMTDQGVWDITFPAQPVRAHPLTQGKVITAEYTTADGQQYVRGVNGIDAPFIFDGASFGTSPGLTFAAPDENLDPGILSFTWVFKNRFFFIEQNSLNIWYLPVGQIGGELTKFSLGGEFSLGGKLVFGATWSIDAGSGLSSMCAFFTDQGEVAVYQGVDPSDVNAWARVGVYTVGRPRGPESYVHRGGDIMVATDTGLIPLSAALQRESATVSLTAVSSLIEDRWREFIRMRPGDWPMAVWTAGQMMVIALPEAIDGSDPVWLVVNARTNRWCVFTGWSAASVCVHGERMFFGSYDGAVYEANVGATDDGRPFTGVYIPVFDQCGVAGNKVVSMARPVTRVSSEAGFQLSTQTDFKLDLPSPPDAPIEVGGGSQWGPTSQWGSAKWGGGGVGSRVVDYWVHLDGGGEVISIAHQVTSAGSIPSDMEFIRTDVLFTSGAIQS